jgi:hypothetical protein
VDPAFGHVLDGLVVVDLLDVEPSLLARYLGRDGATTFLSYHGRNPKAPATSQEHDEIGFYPPPLLDAGSAAGGR